MGNRRHSHSRRRRKAPHSKNITLITLVLLLVCVTAIPALAWLTAKSVVKNQFEIGEGDVMISEDVTDGVNKKDVCFKNDGNVPIYVRASVSIYWKDKDGNIMATVPEAGQDKDYTIEGNLTGTDWVQGADGYYYYTKPLGTGKTTPNLINCVKDNGEYNDGRTFYVDIASQSLQTTPAEAVKEAWGDTNRGGSVLAVDSETGNLTINTGGGA